MDESRKKVDIQWFCVNKFVEKPTIFSSKRKPIKCFFQLETVRLYKTSMRMRTKPNKCGFSF